MGVFSKSNQPEGQVKRNAFDGSFQNNLTLKMGYLYPCFCKEVIPGDTFEIDPAFGLRFMPTAFPLQTKMKAHMEFFFVRNRNLWDQFQNYYFGTGQPDAFPVLSPNEAKVQFRTGSLGDYLGLPSTLVGPNNVLTTAHALRPYSDVPSGYTNRNYQLCLGHYKGSDLVKGSYLFNDALGSDNENSFFYSWINPNSDVDTEVSPSSFGYSDLITPHPTKTGYFLLPFDSNFPSPVYESLVDRTLVLGISLSSYWHATGPNSPYTISVYGSWSDGKPLFLYDDGKVYFYRGAISPNDIVLLSIFALGGHAAVPLKFDYATLPSIVFTSATQSYEVVEAMDHMKAAPLLPSALPFRAYEQIYNSFYRDDRNNPYMVNNVYDPNVFLPTTSGGFDDTPYRLRKRNWEQDFLTTALPSPQFGEAPLVGLTSSGVATFMDSDGNTYTSKLETADDGDTVVAFSTTESPQVNRQLVSLASTGISINDLRGVNSLQRYLETKYRIGLRYRDQMKAHFGIDISMDVLDMPEFIGAVTQSVDVSQINQTAPDAVDPLGSYAGQLSAVGGSSQSIRKYCDEPGYIIGIISVVPVPCYSQLLPKHFLKTNEPLDFYFPEFNHIGFQPIRYDEVCPLQAQNAGIPLDQTFGYQRAWYDYLSNVDEIHGQFRTTLNNFILSRVFNTVPSLNDEFLTIDPDSMNDVFTINEVNGKSVDTILGQIHFKVTMNRPISRFGVPRLE